MTARSFAISTFSLFLLVALCDINGFAQETKPFPRELVEWKPIKENPVFRGTGESTWDRKIRERGYILKVEDEYHLWYTGYNEDRSTTKFLGHATSRDGLKWDRDKRNPIFDQVWTEDVFVLKHDQKYVMFAEGKNDIAHQLTSADGISWKEEGALKVLKADGKTPIEPGPYGTPVVWFENQTWRLFYERGDKGVWLAKSPDRKTWINVQDDPVLAMGPSPYDQTAVAMNQIIKRDGVYYTLYHANTHRPWKDWTTCIARSTDLIHWEKYPKNPIIENNSSSGIFVETPQGLRLYTMHPEVRVHASSIDK